MEFTTKSSSFFYDWPRTEVTPSPGPPISNESDELQATRMVVQRILVPIVVSFGVVGNLLSVVVLTRRGMRSSTNFYLTALAICDVVYLVLTLTLSFVHDPGPMHSYWYQVYLAHAGRPLVNIFSNIGIWLTLTFTVERYIGVCHPMKGIRWCTPERARLVILAVSLAATLATIPEFFVWTVFERPPVNGTTNSTTGSGLYISIGTQFSKSRAFYFGHVIPHQALFTITPLLLLLVFNAFLIKAVVTANKERATMVKSRPTNKAGDSDSREQNRITVMLIAVVIVFVVCQLPQAMQNLYVIYQDSRGLEPTIGEQNRIRISNNVLNLLVMINSSVNFILYSAFSSKFRETFKRLFCTSLATASRKQSDAFPRGVLPGLERPHQQRPSRIVVDLGIKNEPCATPHGDRSFMDNSTKSTRCDDERTNNFLQVRTENGYKENDKTLQDSLTKG